MAPAAVKLPAAARDEAGLRCGARDRRTPPRGGCVSRRDEARPHRRDRNRLVGDEPDDARPLENWLTPLRDIQRLHKSELIRFGKDGSDDRRHRRLVELSVIEQCLGCDSAALV